MKIIKFADNVDEDISGHQYVHPEEQTGWLRSGPVGTQEKEWADYLQYLIEELGNKVKSYHYDNLAELVEDRNGILPSDVEDIVRKLISEYEARIRVLKTFVY